MLSYSRAVFGSIMGISLLMIAILGFHLGGASFLAVGRYSQLFGAFIGGTLILLFVNMPVRPEESMEPWLGGERLAWTLIGVGCILWGIGECFWRYFLFMGENPFPSLADIGYASFPPLVFVGLLLQPSSVKGRGRILVLLDSFISMGSLLAIAWFLLLGALAQLPGEANLAKFLGLYYPTTDMALLSCLIFLLLRGQGRSDQAQARRISLLILALGLVIFATSDFLFNIQQNAGSYADGTWVDLGWPLGIMTVGVAAYVRRMLPASVGYPGESARDQARSWWNSFGLAQFLPYLLIALLFLVLVFNVLSPAKSQQNIRPVLLVVTLLVVVLVITRQIITLLENERLVREQASTLEKLEAVYKSITKRTSELETGIGYLKDIQTRLANGDVRARAHATNGDLWPLAVGLNLMADRMMRSEQAAQSAQKIAKAISDFNSVLDHHTPGTPFVLPASCYGIPEIQRLMRIIDSKQILVSSRYTRRPPTS